MFYFFVTERQLAITTAYGPVSVLQVKQNSPDVFTLHLISDVVVCFAAKTVTYEDVFVSQAPWSMVFWLSYEQIRRLAGASSF